MEDSHGIKAVEKLDGSMENPIKSRSFKEVLTGGSENLAKNKGDLDRHMKPPLVPRYEG